MRMRTERVTLAAARTPNQDTYARARKENRSTSDKVRTARVHCDEYSIVARSVRFLLSREYSRRRRRRKPPGFQNLLSSAFLASGVERARGRRGAPGRSEKSSGDRRVETRADSPRETSSFGSAARLARATRVVAGSDVTRPEI